MKKGRFFVRRLYAAMDDVAGEITTGGSWPPAVAGGMVVNLTWRKVRQALVLVMLITIVWHMTIVLAYGADAAKDHAPPTVIGTAASSALIVMWVGGFGRA